MTTARLAAGRSVKRTVSSSRLSTPSAATPSASSQLGVPAAPSEAHTARHSVLDLPRGRTDWERLKRLTDREVEAAVRDDPDAGPATDEAFWTDAEFIVAPPKEAISIRIDKDVLEWFRGMGRGYQTRINAVLRAYVEARRKAGG